MEAYASNKSIKTSGVERDTSIGSMDDEPSMIGLQDDGPFDRCKSVGGNSPLPSSFNDKQSMVPCDCQCKNLESKFLSATVSI